MTIKHTIPALALLTTFVASTNLALAATPQEAAAQDWIYRSNTHVAGQPWQTVHTVMELSEVGNEAGYWSEAAARSRSTRPARPTRA